MPGREKVEKKTQLNDERFALIVKHNEELRQLAHELNRLVDRKLDELLGHPEEGSGKDAEDKPNRGMVDEVLATQEATIKITKDTLERMGSL
jgi:hypothetical protein